MKHGVEGARRRRQEEETKHEEAKTRARAKADELAKKAEEPKLAKKKEEHEAEAVEEDVASDATAEAEATTPITTSTVTPQNRGQPLSKPLFDPATTSDATGKKDERAKDAFKSGMSSYQTAAKDEAWIKHADTAMRRIEEPPNEDHAYPTNQATTPPTDADEKAGQSDITPSITDNGNHPLKEKTRNGKTIRANRSRGDQASRCKDETKVVTNKEPIAITQDPESISDGVMIPTIMNGDGCPGPMSGSAAVTYCKGDYPVKANGTNGVVKISDTTPIHAKLSLQSVGDQNLVLAEEVGIEVQAEHLAEDWDSDATQVEEMDVKDDALALDPDPKVTREEELLAQVALLCSELALCQEETASIHEDLLQVQAISQTYEDRLAEMTLTFEDFKRMHGHEIEKSAQTIKTLEAQLASVEERAETSASYMVDMKSQLNQGRVAWRKDKEQHVKQTTELEMFKFRVEYAESRLQSAELSWENEKSTMQRNLSEVEKCCTELKDQNEKLHRNLEDLSAQALSIQQNASAQALSAESREGASSARQDSNLQESRRSKQQLDQTDKTFEEAHTLLSKDRNLQQTVIVPKELHERVTEQTSQLCFTRNGNILLRTEDQKLLRQDSLLEKNGCCMQVELSSLSVRVQEVETEIEPRAENCCIDPAEFQELKDANEQYRTESAENTTTMTALKMEQESLQARLEELESRFNKMDALNVSFARVSAQHSQPIWGATSGVDSVSQGGAHPMMMVASGLSGTGYPTQPYPVMMPPYYPQGYPSQPMFFQRPLPPPMYAFPVGAMAPYGFMPISPVDACGSPEPTSQALTAMASGTMNPTNQYPHQNPHQHPQHLVGPPPRVPHPAVATPAVNSLQL
ncbi:hypothetical protein BGX29_011434 [Mortierella sp. GBA35]|nr:hypothetical protein BGX29_011434 [Mortierella sp. GBA35]